MAARCLETIVLTALRLDEAREGTWDELDFDNKVWTIPANRMKAEKEHRVPLSAAALTVLKGMADIRQSDYVFPGAQGGAVAKTMPWRLLKQLAGNVTIHGFRSSFRDWAAERTSYPREVAEMALAHTIPNAVEAAYLRSDLFEKRRRLMSAWADYCGKPTATAKVLPIRVR